MNERSRKWLETRHELAAIKASGPCLASGAVALKLGHRATLFVEMRAQKT
jgi:hypothetical protein